MKRPVAYILVGAVAVFLMSHSDLYAQNSLEPDLDETGGAEREWGIGFSFGIL